MIQSAIEFNYILTGNELNEDIIKNLITYSNSIHHSYAHNTRLFIALKDTNTILHRFSIYKQMLLY